MWGIIKLNINIINPFILFFILLILVDPSFSLNISSKLHAYRFLFSGNNFPRRKPSLLTMRTHYKLLRRNKKLRLSIQARWAWFSYPKWYSRCIYIYIIVYIKLKYIHMKTKKNEGRNSNPISWGKMKPLGMNPLCCSLIALFVQTRKGNYFLIQCTWPTFFCI